MASIMIVDDSSFMRNLIRSIITRHGHTVVAEAPNGNIAIGLFIKYKPELITMDITMPEMDGIKAVEVICKLNPEARIVMCSAMGQQAMVIDAIRFGAKDFIVKPFEQSKLIEVINKVLIKETRNLI